VAQGGLGRRALREGGDHGARLAGRPPQDGVDEAGAARRVPLGERDGLRHRGVGRHAVEEHELEDAESERGQDRGLEPARRPLGERGDHVVERRAPLDGAVGELGGERALAGRQLEPRGLGVQRAVGVRILLEDAPHDRVRTRAACGWLPRAWDVTLGRQRGA
jgi:hypothetical protein